MVKAVSESQNEDEDDAGRYKPSTPEAVKKIVPQDKQSFKLSLDDFTAIQSGICGKSVRFSDPKFDHEAENAFSEQWIRGNCVVCPGCGVWIQKDYGSMDMKCEFAHAGDEMGH